MKVRVFEKINTSWQREDLSNNNNNENNNNHNHDHSVSNDNIFFICFVDYFQRETKMHLKPIQLMLHCKFLSKQEILLDCKIIF